MSLVRLGSILSPCRCHLSLHSSIHQMLQQIHNPQKFDLLFLALNLLHMSDIHHPPVMNNCLSLLLRRKLHCRHFLTETHFPDHNIERNKNQIDSASTPPDLSWSNLEAQNYCCPESIRTPQTQERWQGESTSS